MTPIRRKQIGRYAYRVIRVATCKCGSLFDVTTRHPEQVYCSRTCRDSYSAMAQHLTRRETRDRQLMQLAEQFAERRRFTESALLDVLRRVDSDGFHRGYNAGRRSIVPPTEAEWWRKRRNGTAA